MLTSTHTFFIAYLFFAGEGDRDACMSHRAHVEVRGFSPCTMRVPETEVCLASLVAGACFYLLSHLATPTPTGGLLGAGSIITIAFCKLTVPTIDMTHSQ